jgi:hypothetical protein
MRKLHGNARLFLNDREVGSVKLTGCDDAWGFGEFSPGEGFGAYANRFGAWSLLMHADDDADGRMSDAAAEELRKVEYDIDRIHAKLFLVGRREWRKISQLNIDGPLIEWREDFSAEEQPSAA